MDSSKLAIKFFTRPGPELHADAFVPIFHQWIQRQALADHLLIDVADYKHVRSGPGTVLVAHEANLSTDAADNRLGLLCVRKTPLSGDLSERLRATFRAALHACQLLEQSPTLAGQITFRTDDPVLRIHDRLFAPNTAETFAAVQPALESFLNTLYGGPVKLTHEPNEETLFEVKIAAPASPSVSELLKRT
jgi:hypothetical protein